MGATHAAIFINLVPVFTSLMGVALVIVGVIATMTAVNKPIATPLVVQTSRE